MSLQIKSHGKAKRIWVALLGVLVLLLVIGAINAPPDQNSQTPTPTAQPKKPTIQVTTKKAQPKPTITTKNSTEIIPIPYSSTTENDNTLASGTKVTAIAGVNGEKTITYHDTYTNGKQTAHTEIGEAVTKQPVTQVEKVGTMVAAPQPAQPAPAPQPSCPNGTYVNTAGNTVCSPYASSTVPTGATAQCVDGTYSFSQSRSGTCSHHGGVATWY